MSFPAATSARCLRAAASHPRGRTKPDRSSRQPLPAPCSAGFCGLALGLFFLLPGLATAQILIEPQIGFHGVFQLGRPFPLQIELSNSGRPAEGLLEVRVWKGGATKGGPPYPVDYRREVYVSSHARKSVQLTVDPDFISRPLTITFSSGGGKALREVDLRRYFSPAPVILFASDGNLTPPLSLGSTFPNRVIGLSLAELPSDGRALLGVSHLILYDPSLRELSRAQLRALESWLTAGGRIVVLGSLNYALYQEPALSRFLPVRVTGMKRISHLSALAQGDGRLPAAGVWAQTSTLVRGKILAEAEGVPLLVEMDRGKGRIIYLAVDIARPPLSQWNGLPKLLRNLLASAAGDEPPPRTRWDDAVFSQLIVSPSFISSYVPTGSLFLSMVGYLGGIGLFAWLLQRQRAKLRAVVAALAIFLGLATAGGYLWFSRGGNIPDAVLLSATVLENSSDGYADAQANLALFSTQIRRYSLRLEGGWTEWFPVSHPAKEQAAAPVVIEDGGSFSRFQLPLREWDYRLFRMRFMDYFPLRVGFEQQGEKARVTVDNRSPKDLSDCWLIMPGQRYALGEIPRGTSWTRTFAVGGQSQEAGGSGRSDAVDFRDLPFKDKTRELLFHSSFFPRDDASGRWSHGAAVFFGWVKEPEKRVTVEESGIRIYDYTLFRAIIPLGNAEDE